MAIKMDKLHTKVSTKGDVEESKCVKSFKCPECNECFRYRRHYDKHMEGHRQNNCKHCGRLFTVRKKLVNHLHDKHNITLRGSKHFCKYCDRSFVKKGSLYQHYQLHAAGKYVCLFCGMFFNEFNEYTRHQEKHKYEKPYKCGKCEEKFSRRQQYLLHIKGHEKYKCLTCKEGFSAQFKLTEHKRKGHNIEELEATHVCEKCQRAFHLQRALVLHQRVHKGEESFKCMDCDKDFISRKSYSKHLRSLHHLREKREKTTANIGVFICEICGKICKEKHALSLHVTRVHSKEEPKKCFFCDYRSTSKANLKRHMEFHTEDRKFICECCGASFYMLCTLKEHYLYVHSEERNFQCSVCGKQFKRRCGLNRHMKGHSESRPYKCHCGQTYKRMSHLKRHKESSHGLVSEPNNLCRLRCDKSGVLVPFIEEGGTKSIKRTSKDLKNIPERLATNKEGSKIEFLVTSFDSHSAEGTKLISTDVQNVESIPCSAIPNIHIELNVNSNSTLSEPSDELRLMKKTMNLTCLLPDNISMAQGDSKTLSYFDAVVSANDSMPQGTLSDMSLNSSSIKKSNCLQDTYQSVDGISHNQQVSNFPHNELAHLIQEPQCSVPAVEFVQVVTPGNVLTNETMVLLCLSSMPMAATGDGCQ